MAPEIFRENYGRLVDVWALGVLCFNMVTGLWPFDAPTEEDFARCVRKGTWTSPIPEELGLSGPLQQLLCWMLTPQPDNRPTATEVQQHRWCASLAASAVPPPAAVTRSSSLPRGPERDSPHADQDTPSGEGAGDDAEAYCKDTVHMQHTPNGGQLWFSSTGSSRKHPSAMLDSELAALHWQAKQMAPGGGELPEESSATKQARRRTVDCGKMGKLCAMYGVDEDACLKERATTAPKRPLQPAASPAAPKGLESHLRSLANGEISLLKMMQEIGFSAEVAAAAPEQTLVGKGNQITATYKLLKSHIVSKQLEGANH